MIKQVVSPVATADLQKPQCFHISYNTPHEPYPHPGKQFLSSTWQEAFLNHKDITLKYISEEW